MLSFSMVLVNAMTLLLTFSSTVASVEMVLAVVDTGGGGCGHWMVSVGVECYKTWYMDRKRRRIRSLI